MPQLTVVNDPVVSDPVVSDPVVAIVLLIRSERTKSPASLKKPGILLYLLLQNVT